MISLKKVGGEVSRFWANAPIKDPTLAPPCRETRQGRIAEARLRIGAGERFIVIAKLRYAPARPELAATPRARIEGTLRLTHQRAYWMS